MSFLIHPVRELVLVPSDPCTYIVMQDEQKTHFVSILPEKERESKKIATHFVKEDVKKADIDDPDKIKSHGKLKRTRR